MDRAKSFEKHTYFMIILLVVFLGKIGLASNGSEASPHVAVSGERISVQAMGVPLGDLLEVIEKKTGIQFVVNEGIFEEKVFVDLGELHLSEGIKKIMPSLNHAIIYGPSGEIRKVVLIGQSKPSEMVTVNRKSGDSESDRSYARVHDQIVQSEASSQGGRGQKQAPSGSGKPVIEGPPGADSVKHQGPPGSQIPVIKGPPTEDIIKHNPPPGSDTTVITGPPTEDIIKRKPPPGSDVTVIEGPPKGDPPPPRAPLDSGPKSGESPLPTQKGD